MIETTAGSTELAGRSVADFSKQVGLSRAAFYLIPDDAKPGSVHIGRRQIITESPAGWLARMKERGGVKLRKAGREHADVSA
jgi:hypothetical protein